jgi:hypothetical protein
MKRVFTALFLSLISVLAPALAYAEPGDLASGSGVVSNGDTTTFSFNAVGGPGNSATGTFTLAGLLGPNTGTVYCLVVNGNSAMVGGVITAGAFVGRQILMPAVDVSPTGAGDQWNVQIQLAGAPPVTCLETVGAATILSGNIVVVDCDGKKAKKEKDKKDKKDKCQPL